MKQVMRAAVFALVLGLGLLPGCRREPSAATPELAYRTFAEALQRGQARAAWGLLSEKTKERVKAKSKELSELSKGAITDQPEVLLFQGSRPGAVSSITQLSADETTATLQVVTATGTTEVKLVRDSGKWFVDLSDTL
jgi:hypothetical protein